jgi:fumarate reductase (CoM/CoB) subunit A
VKTLSLDIIDTGVLIVGGGLAGLCAAIASSSNKTPTLIATKTLVGGANTTSMAAGVTSAVTQFKDPKDSVEVHLRDTLEGGCGINDRAMANMMVNEAPKYFDLLMKMGLEYETGRDGKPAPRFVPGHSFPRSYFMKGYGVRIQSILKSQAENQGTKFMEKTLLTSLVKEGGRVVGAVGCANGKAIAIRSKCVILASGGAGELYSRTLMPIGSSGYGTSLGLLAGAEVVDMEFVQFYPMMVYEKDLPKLFIDYAPLLKHGATVENAEGEDILKKGGIDEPFKLTRDRFSIMMAREMSGSGRGGEGSMYLNCTKINQDDIKDNSALVTAYSWLEKKVPIKERRFGISPYVHFFMGGLRTDQDGATNVPGLFAAGEAVGGIHGANRIGGNAFAGCMVFGSRAGQAASLFKGYVDLAPKNTFKEPLSALESMIGDDGGELEASKAKSKIQQIMWDSFGIIRSRDGMELGMAKLNSLREFSIKSKDPLGKLLIPMMLDSAEVIALSAILREESRGAHYRTDFSDESKQWGAKRIMLKLENQICDVKYVAP